MYNVTIQCPVQYGTIFDPEGCYECKYFDMHVGNKRSWICRKNREGRHKDAFTLIHATERLAHLDLEPIAVTIEEPEKKKKEV